MDIQIIQAEQTGPWIILGRTLDGALNLERMPRETLAIRAAEYDLAADDPFVLDLVLLERFVEVDNPDEVHPLFSAATLTEAVATMRARVESVRVAHGAPAGKNRVMAAAVKNGVATDGLVQAQALLIAHADPAVAAPVKYLRDAERARLRERAAGPQLRERTLADQLTAEVELRQRKPVHPRSERLPEPVQVVTPPVAEDATIGVRETRSPRG